MTFRIVELFGPLISVLKSVMIGSLVRALHIVTKVLRKGGAHTHPARYPCQNDRDQERLIFYSAPFNVSIFELHRGRLQC